MLTLPWNHASSTGCLLSLGRFQFDFERASLQTIRIVFLHDELKGFNFHLNQCMWRKLQRGGLTVLETKEAVRAMVALASVAFGVVDDARLEVETNSM